MSFREKIKSDQRLKDFILWTLTPKRNPRPRLWVRWFLNPFFHKKGKGSLIRGRSRIDVFPYNKFNVGDHATIEDFTVINNGSGNVIIGNSARVGIGSVIIGPVTLGNGSGLSQHVFISGFNHDYSDGTKNSSGQGLVVKPVVIGDEVHIGANSVVTAGVTIGERTQIGAGSVVTKNIPPFSVAVGNPCRVIKQFNQKTNQWEKI
ncbi:MAG: acyltransferase [Bacteroidetes bacterium]|nr:acyltransferase [Bacteroidota bacterium]